VLANRHLDWKFATDFGQHRNRHVDARSVRHLDRELGGSDPDRAGDAELKIEIDGRLIRHPYSDAGPAIQRQPLRLERARQPSIPFVLLDLALNCGVQVVDVDLQFRRDAGRVDGLRPMPLRVRQVVPMDLVAHQRADALERAVDFTRSRICSIQSKRPSGYQMILRMP
jgi:hypothetical protein